ncbi:MAG: hypothetical protein KJ058_00480 [Thermoanaerobaculia bacterium]|nr:hypothetical protein [Thermoanaerobaculia bacterium]
MRVARPRIRRAGGAVTAAATPAARPPAELGASGTINLSGFLQGEEYLRDLQGQQGQDVYRRMRRSDPAVREALWHIFAPILNATWDVEPPPHGDDTDMEITVALRHAYFGGWLDPKRGFRQHVRQALDHLTYGHALFEPVWHVKEAELTLDTETGPTTLPPRQFLTWLRFAPRLPRTVYRWNTDGGDLLSVTQHAYRPDGSYNQVEIPADRLLVFVNEMEGDDWAGVSILRSAYKPWFMKELVEKVMGVSVERHGVGINTAYMPDRFRDDEAMVTRVEEMLRDVGSGDRPYLVFPGPKATAGQEGRDGFLFEIVTPASSLPDLVKVCEYFRGDIKGNVLARFAELGHASVGARATGDVQSEVWYDALHQVASYICDVHNGDAIPRWVRANYGDRAAYPRLVAQDIESRSLDEFAGAVSRLVVSGAAVADGSLRGFVRRAIGGPDEDDPEGACGVEPDDGPDADVIEDEG